MASKTAKFTNALLFKFLNMNPEGGNGFAATTRKVSTDGVKVKKGYVRAVEKTPDGVTFERIKPISGTNGKVVLYLHGGGYVVGLTQMYRTFACDLSKAAGGAECILLDYSIAPECLYPTQHNEAYSLWKYIVDAQGVDPQNIVIGGDSAGGNLTAGLMLHVRDDGYKMPAGIVLISPWTDMLASGQSYAKNYNVDPLFGEKGKVLDDERKARLLKSEMYVWCGDADREDPLVSPVFGDYHGFPSTLITVGGAELLLDDSLTIADNMKRNGVDVKVICDEGLFHIYPLFSIVPEGKAAFEKILEFVAEKLA